MNILLEEINVDKMLSVEQHIYLYLFSCFNETESSYEETIFDEGLISKYNKHIKNPSVKGQFTKYLQTNMDFIEQFIQNFESEPWKYAKPIIWNDRDKDDYYIDNLTKSHRFEIYIERLLENEGINLGLYYSRAEQYEEGENELGIEIKRDIQSWNTGNMYFEYAERLKKTGKWVKSGILKDDNTKYFLIGDIERFHIVKKNVLVKIYNFLKRNNLKEYKGIQLKKARRGTSLGFIIPLEKVEKISMSMKQLVKELKQ